jgi:DNA helicase-2/ATP-dependent DNA helicase PcrA
MQEDFVSDFQANAITLDENYRCSKSVIEASNSLMDLDVEAVNYVIEGIFEIHSSISEIDEAQFVFNKIGELISLKTHNDIEGKITYDKIAILARNKFVFKHIDELLTNERVPFYFKSGNVGIKFSSSLMKIFDLFFRVKVNPFDKLHLKRLEDLLKISDIYNPNEINSSKFPIAASIRHIVNEITIDNFHLKIEALRILFESANLEDDEKKMTLDELDDFANQLIQYKKQNIKPTLEGFKSAIALGLTNNSTSNENGVCLSTVHTMKGQESEIVFLIGMDDGTFPDFRAVNKGGEELQQEKNNTYVAFTRAKRFLYVTYPKKRLMPWGDYKARAISRFLKPLIK